MKKDDEPALNEPTFDEVAFDEVAPELVVATHDESSAPRKQLEKEAIDSYAALYSIKDPKEFADRVFQMCLDDVLSKLWN